MCFTAGTSPTLVNSFSMARSRMAVKRVCLRVDPTHSTYEVMDGANRPRKLMRRSSRAARPLVWLTRTPPPPPPPPDGGGRRRVSPHDVPPERHRRLTNVLRRPVNSTISISENTGKMYFHGSMGCAKKCNLL